MKSRVFALSISMALVLSLAGCGKTGTAGNSTAAAETNTAAETSAAETKAPIEVQTETQAKTQTEAQASAEDDGQNPVMNFVGVYSTDHSREAMVEADGKEDARITVTYAASPWFHDVTVMSGHFDPETATMDFSDAKMTEYVYNSDGSVREEKVSYTDGSGTAVFSLADNTLTITEKLPSGDSKTVFRWGPSSDMKKVTDPKHYEMVTAMDKYEVENVVGYNVRTAYLSENWFAMADMIDYPIVINGTSLADSNAFIGYMQDKTLADSDRQVMSEETLLDMFVNGQGICMGSGQVWLNDSSYMTDKEPDLKIIALSGIVNRDGENSEAAGVGRQEGERFESVITIEGMEETVNYEHIRNESLGFEMDYDYERFERRSEADRESFFLTYDDPGKPENYFEVIRSAESAETVAASVGEELSKEYTISKEDFTLEGAGSCIRIDASVDLSGTNMPEQLQEVFIIPSGDGSLVIRAHYCIDSVEGIGRRVSAMLNTLSLI